MKDNIIGIIGGSGLYAMQGFEIIEEKKVSTPFGEPSDKVVLGTLSGIKVAFLPRHGVGHRIPPGKINYRANICAMKRLGVNSLISVSAVGSLKEEIKPGHLVIVDQFIDRTKFRAQTFFEDVVAHVAFAKPVCANLASSLYDAAKSLGITVHAKGTYVCMEGPAFSTRAESLLHKAWGADLIGMTNMPEAKLAREAEICYSTIALSTDYDAWKDEDHVDVVAVLEIIRANVANAQAVIKAALPKITDERNCVCASALKGAIMTDPKLIPKDVKKKLEPIAGRYLK